jgi:hypothetical protein
LITPYADIGGQKIRRFTGLYDKPERNRVLGEKIKHRPFSRLKEKGRCLKKENIFC